MTNVKDKTGSIELGVDTPRVSIIGTLASPLASNHPGWGGGRAGLEAGGNVLAAPNRPGMLKITRGWDLISYMLRPSPPATL